MKGGKYLSEDEKEMRYFKVKDYLFKSPTVHCIIESFHCSSFHVAISTYMKVHAAGIALIKNFRQRVFGRVVCEMK